MIRYQLFKVFLCQEEEDNAAKMNKMIARKEEKYEAI